MPTSWEEKAAKKVLTCILHTDATTMAWSLGLRNLLPHDMPILPLTGMPYDHSRNLGAKVALENGFDHVFYLDSDVVAPHDAVLRLLAHNKPFISGLYNRRSPPHSVPVAIKDGSWYTSIPLGATVEVDLVGSGCLLISRQLLEKIPPQRPGKPWFDWRVDLKGLLPEGECLSEDFTLCAHIRKLGLAKVYLDSSIRCKHVGLAESDFGTFLPCETRSVT